MKKSSTRPAWSLALALEPRMMFDAAAVTTAADVAEATAVAATAPAATATPVADGVFIIDATGTPGSDVRLFNDASVSADSGGEEISKLVVTVSTTGSNQALVVDGTAISLTATSAFGETDKSHYSYRVEVSDTTTTLTLFLNNAATVTPAAVETLIEGIGYRALDGEVSNGEVTVTLKSLTDAGNDVALLDISATLTVENDKNLAPHIDGTHDLSLLDDLTATELNDTAAAVSYSLDGDFAYVASSTGTLVVYSVADSGVMTKIQTFSDTNSLNAVNGMAVGKDAVYVLSGSTIVVLNRAADGMLSVGSTLAVGDESRNVAISEDGAQLYVSARWNGIYVYDIGADGVLSFSSRYTENADRSAGLTSVGDYVFVMAPGGSFQTLTVLKRAVVGGVTSLSLVDTTTIDSSFDFTSAWQLAASGDGGRIFTLNTSTGDLIVWRFDGSILTKIETRSVASATDLAVSRDGSLLYVGTGEGQLSVYAVGTSGTLTLLSSQSTGGSAALAAFGTSLAAVGGSSVEVYTSIITYTVGSSPVPVTRGMTVSDSNADVLNDGAGNYNGATITLTASGSNDSQFSFASDSGLIRQGNQLQLDGAVIASVESTANAFKVTFTADITTATANKVLQQIMWATSGTSSALVTLNVVVNDGQLNSNTGSVLLRVNTSPLIDPDVAADFTLPQGTSETDYWLELPDLFRDEDGDNLLWAVSGLPDGLTFNAETQTISGSTTETGTFNLILSVRDSSGAVASLSRDLVIVQIDNRSPEVNWDASTALSPAVVDTPFSLTLDRTLFSDADAIYGDTLAWSVEGLPDGLTFDPATLTVSGTATSLTEATLTVTVTDKSGDTASREMTLRVITAEENANTQPTLTPMASSLIYTSEGGLSGYSYYVDAITLSDDGTRLVVIGTTGTNWGGTLYVSVYSRDTASGELTLQKTYTQGTADDSSTAAIEMEGLKGTTQALFSPDGRTLYLSGTNSSNQAVLQAFTLGADASLTAVSGIDLSAAAVKLALSDDGSSVYAVTTSGLFRFAVDAQGALSARESFTDLGSVLTMDADQNGVFYVIASTGTIAVYTTDDSGMLSFAGKLTRSGTELTWTSKDGNASSAGTLSSGSGLNGTFMQMSAGGEGYVYVVTGTNGYLTVLHFDADSGSMALVSSRSVYSELGGVNPMSVVVSQDGTALYVGSNGTSLVMYTIGDGGTLTYTRKITGDGALIAMAVSADGKSLYGGSRFYKNGLRLFDSAVDATEIAWTERDSSQIAGQLVLGDADYDASNNGAGDYNGAVITVQREWGASADDSYSFVEGNGLALENGNITLDGLAIATFTVSGGMLTVTFTGEVSTAVANRVLHQISWQSTSKAPGSTLTMVVSISDPWTTASQSVLVNVTEVNDAPEVTAVGNDPTYRDTAGTVLVFGNAAVDTVESGQQIVQITLTVSGLVSGENDYLTIDGTRVLLQDGVRVLTNNNIVIAVSVKEGVASLTIVSDAGIEAEQAQSLLNSIGYGNPEAYIGSREIVLTSIKDNGGTERGGSDTALLDIRSTVTLQAQDAGPKLTSPDTDKLTWSGSLSEIDGLGTLSKSALSADGTHLYATDGSGTLALFSRDTVTGALTWVRNLSTGLANIDNITLLDNGSRLAISTLSDSASSSYTLSIFSVAEDGSMTPLDSTSLWSVTSVLASDDGRLLYVFDMNGISVISIDADTGAMTTLQDIYADAWSEPHLWQVVNSAVTGDYLYVLTDPVSAQFPNAVIVYQRQADGTLALFGAVYDGRTDASGTALTLGSPSAVTASDDGSLIYVQTSDGLQIFSLNQKSGQIVRVAVMSDITGVNALAQGGGNLYVSLSDGSLQVYSVGTSGQLTLSSTWRSSDYAALAGATALMPTRDGGVVVGGSQLASLVTVVEDVRYTLGDTAALNFSDDVTLTHKALDVLNDGIGNYGGVDVIVSDSSGLGSFGFTSGSGLVMNSDGQVLDGGTLIASYVHSSAGLTLTFTDGVTTATANRVIASLTWFNADNATGRNVTLSIAVSDGELTSEVWQQNIVINHVPQATDIVYVPAVITLGKGYTAMLPSELFSDADGDTLSWSIEGLPEGIAFDAATRTLTGTATTAGRYTLTVTVTDGDGASAVRQLTLRVNTPPELGAGETHFSVLSGSAIDLTLDDTLFSDADGDALQWRVDNLPAGLTFDADTRTLNGTLPSGNYSLTLTATDTWGASISRTLVLLSNRVPLVIDSAFTLPDATAQRGWQQVLPAGLFEDPDGDALVWQVDGLPDGMHFEPETRTLAGEPIAAGRFLLTVTVTDPWGGVTSRTLTLVVLAAQPEQPEQPEEPQQPEQPEEPQRPEQPQQPGEPHQPEQPQQPQRPDEPGKPTRTPVDPDILETTAWSPFIGERDRQQFLWQAPEKQPDISADRPRDPLVLSDTPVLATGPLDYTASPWQLDPLMAQRLPTLEPVKNATADAIDPALARTVAWQGEWIDAGNGTKTYTLPPGLAGRGGIISVRLANGRPLPEWVRFDAAHSRLYLSGADAERVGQIQLRLQRANGEPALLLTLSGSDVQVGTHARERSPLPTSGGRITAPDGAFNTGVSHALDALRGDGDDLLLALNALARD